MEPLQFKTKLQSRPVVLEAEDGAQSQYELREMTVAERDKYLNTVSSRMRFDANGKPCGIRNFDGMHADLLTRCMFKMNPDGSSTPVTKKEVDAWPSASSAVIFSAAQELNQLNRADQLDEGADAKNE